jgi:outer membrane murein-binding lipoprotein Lpp
MKNLVRMVTAAAVLGSALVLAGCVNQTARRPQVKAVEEFAVVESSTSQELTPAQIAELRQAVINYLHEQGMGNGRIYYVRVTFPPVNPDDEPEWAVVRIGNLPTRSFTVLAAYPGADDFYPYEIYRSSYYGGYSGFSRWGYYDPFDYNYGYATNPPVPPRDHPRDNHDHKRNDQPGNKPYPPPGTRTRWDGNPRTSPGEPRSHSPHPGNDRRDHDRNHKGGSHRDADGSRSPTPPPERSYTPPPERSYSPPPPAPERSYSPPAVQDQVQATHMAPQQVFTSEKEK